MSVELKRLEKTLADYRQLKVQAVENAGRLLTEFHAQEIRQNFQAYKNRRIKAAAGLVETFEAKGLARYDIFRIAGFVAGENDFSDAIASLLDPNRPHQLGTLPLRSLLMALQHRSDKTISAILKLLESPQTNIRVQRELNLGNTRPDIAIRSEDFVILIENKLRGGQETGGGTQTVRQWEALENLGRQYETANLLGIFLTPEGKTPASSDFVALPVRELVGAMRQALEQAPWCDYKAMIEAFLDFYNWSDC